MPIAVHLYSSSLPEMTRDGAGSASRAKQHARQNLRLRHIDSAQKNTWHVLPMLHSSMTIWTHSVPSTLA